MSRRSLLVLGLAAAVASAALWWFRGEPEGGPAAGSAKLFPDLDPGSALSISIRSSEGPVRLERVDGGWALREPEADEADPERAEGLLGTLAEATALREIAAAGEDPSPFGLDDPLAEATVTIPEGGSFTLRLGRASPVGFERYASTGEGGAVVLVDGSLGTALERPAGAFRQMRLVPMPTGAVRTIRIERSDGVLEIVREGNGWRIAEPIADRADEAVADALARTVTGMTLVTRGPGPEAESDGALRIRVEGDGPTVAAAEVLVAPSEEGKSVRASRIGSPVSGTLARWVLEDLSRPAEAYRDRRVTRFSTPDVLELRFERDGSAFSVRRRGEGEPWVLSAPGAADRTADASTVERVLDALRWLRAERFLPGSPEETSEARCEIVGGDGLLGWIAWSGEGDSTRLRSSWRDGAILFPEAGGLEDLPHRPGDLLPPGDPLLEAP